MGTYLSTPVTTKETTCGGNEALHFAHSSMQGWRVSMEVLHLFDIFLFIYFF